MYVYFISGGLLFGKASYLAGLIDCVAIVFVFDTFVALFGTLETIDKNPDLFMNSRAKQRAKKSYLDIIVQSEGKQHDKLKVHFQKICIQVAGLIKCRT